MNTPATSAYYVDANWQAWSGKMNNLSSDRHAEFIM